MRSRSGSRGLGFIGSMNDVSSTTAIVRLCGGGGGIITNATSDAMNGVYFLISEYPFPSTFRSSTAPART